MKHLLFDDLYEMSKLKTSPDRFWRRVLIQVDKKKPTRPTRNGNNLFHECCRFARRWENSEPEQYEELTKDFPTIMPAYTIYTANDGVKWYLEAGLTSDAALTDIAQYIGETPAVVSRYAQLFYDVKDWMASEGCIAAYVLRPKAVAFSPLDSDFLYKTISYAYGWDIFKAFVGVKELKAEHRVKLHTTFRDALLKTGWLAVNKLRLNNYNTLEAIARCLDLDTLKVQEESLGGINQNGEMEAVKAVLASYKMDILAEPSTLKQAELAIPEEAVKHAN